MTHNTLLHRAIRPAAVRLARSRMTPDLATGLRLSTGLAAAACFAAGPPWFGAGGGLFLVSMLLDRFDGELARQSRRFSRLGGRFDLVADCISTMAVFVGLGLGAGAMLPFGIGAGSAPGPLLGLAAALSTGLLFTLLALAPARDGPVSRAFDPDDLMLVVPVAIWCGGAGWILLLAGLVTPLAAILLVLLNGWSRPFPAGRARGRRRAAPGKP